MSPPDFLSVVYSNTGVKRVTYPVGRKILMTTHREEHPSDSEEDGYSTGEDEGTREYLRPRKKRRGVDGDAIPVPQPSTSNASPGLQPGHVQVHEKTLSELMKSSRKVDVLVDRVEAETGVKVPRKPKDPMRPVLRAGQKVQTCFYVATPPKMSLAKLTCVVSHLPPCTVLAYFIPKDSSL